MRTLTSGTTLVSTSAMVVAIKELPPSTLALLNAHYTGDLGAATARGWADDMLTGGVSSDALIDMALLADHEWQRAGQLLHKALNDAGIATEPPWQLSLMFFRLLLQAYLEDRLTTGEFSQNFEQAYNFGPSTEGVPENLTAALSSVFEAVVMYSPCEQDRAENAAYTGEDEIRDVARSAALQLTS